MNLPNKITIARIILVPICIIFLMMDFIPHHYFLALIVFAVASLSDCVDGKIARKRNLVTNFGKFLDPLADKMLVCSVLICFIEKDIASAVAVVCIIFREFAVSSLRLIAVDGGKVIAANIWGKIKTTVQMTGISVILLLSEINCMGIINMEFPFTMCNSIIIWTMTAATVISGITYIIDNRECISQK